MTAGASNLRPEHETIIGGGTGAEGEGRARGNEHILPHRRKRTTADAGTSTKQGGEGARERRSRGDGEGRGRRGKSEEGERMEGTRSGPHFLAIIHTTAFLFVTLAASHRPEPGGPNMKPSSGGERVLKGKGEPGETSIYCRTGESGQPQTLALATCGPKN